MLAIRRSGADRPRCPGVGEPLVAARKREILPSRAKELDRGQVQRIKRANRRRKGLEGTRQDRRSKLEERHMSQKHPYGFPVRSGEPPAVDPVPDLVFQQPTGDECLAPELYRRNPVFGEQLSEGD